MRTVRITGEKMNGENVQFLSFPVRIWDDDPAPSGNAIGTFYNFGAGDAPFMCVSKYDLAELWGRQRKFQCNIFIEGQYQIPEVPPGDTGDDPPWEPGTYDFAIDRNILIDVVKPGALGAPPWERFLPHARKVFWNTYLEPEDYALLSSLDLQIRGASGSDYLLPLNTHLPLELYDTDGFGNTKPDVVYSPTRNAFYISFGFPVLGLKVLYGIPGNGHSYNFSYVANVGNATPADGIAGDGIYYTYRDAGSMSIGTWSLPAYTMIPSVIAPDTSITGDPVFTVAAPDTDGYFEFRRPEYDEDGETILGYIEPCWDKDNGSQLITPLPMSQ